MFKNSGRYPPYMPLYDVTHLIQAHPVIWERERIRPVKINRELQKLLNELDQKVFSYARSLIFAPQTIIDERARKLEHVAEETGISAEELAKADLEMDVNRTLADFQNPPRPGCYSPKDITNYAEGCFTGQERESIFRHCDGCRPCLIDVFQYYSTMVRKSERENP